MVTPTPGHGWLYSTGAQVWQTFSVIIVPTIFFMGRWLLTSIGPWRALSPWSADASPRDILPRLGLIENPRWHTNAPAAPGNWYRVVLDKPRVLSRVEFYPKVDDRFPERFSLWIQPDEDTGRVQLGEFEGPIDCKFSPRSVYAVEARVIKPHRDTSKEGNVIAGWSVSKVVVTECLFLGWKWPTRRLSSKVNGREPR